MRQVKVSRFPSLLMGFISYAIASTLLWGLIISATSCASKEDFQAAPYIPPRYYQCQQASAEEIAFAYWSPYNQRYLAEGGVDRIPGESIRGVVFVLKDYLVNEYLLRDKEQGYIWLDMIKCYPIDVASIKQLESGTRIDVVGVNSGPELDNYLEYDGGTVVFEECVIFPTGSIRLPAEGTDWIPVIPAY